ncbi:phage head morphogenesis protein [Pluralibacter gergoviae]|uniref:Phage head morphogenesis protein n=1 Tax=Pluralibacter gergoviae TaxID=61647 RepID=A0AAI9DLS6_PLUGE|nr:phage head morphogenesis protein [Pluralibacter gergoviae]EKV9907724.1 phage head morphogenesis protein [Pluralibacter gergoviae]EKW7276807.1 phage head morphogenesis protein [Pluralibacter gergoviae]ELD4293944.1 phage head morphogenesis protein [Pluralibacter gergoviae]ELD4304723.1 phage head morphogenesis protein [Pluralibacter gergoviae]
MAREIDEALTPVLHRNYTPDSHMTDLLVQAIELARQRFVERTLGGTGQRLAHTVVSRAESESTAAFVEQINRAMGVNLSGLLGGESLADYLGAAVAENVALIKSLSGDYFVDIQRQVMDGVRQGLSLTDIVANIQRTTGAAYNRAALIGRDQVSKLRADITLKRQESAGFTRFRWSTSQDIRVSGNPAGKYPNAKIKCFAIARTDIGYGPGIYLLSQGATCDGESGLFPGRAHIGCRCTSIPQIEGVDY